MIPLAEVRDLFRDNSVAVVGNSARLLDRTDGAAIDACDLVLRMNHGMPQQASRAALGTRTDIWACSFNNQRLQLRELPMFKPKLVVHLPADKRHIHPELLPRMYVDDPGNARRLARKLDVGWPSTGSLVLHFLLDTVANCGQLHVFGYDHFRRPNFYVPERRPSHDKHSPHAEKCYMRDLGTAGRVTLY